ncbi:ATP synthase F0 subunit 6 (mitochondrion) [Frieseomelitta varia]|uniref:ATP synthase subunit a n=1 Tax=Frieseomelitta varia TaxID=561572 RepID=A0A833S2H6_9HYME|nr:ATP synthase F0 subunit 6 [Frieseomelitta varia]
MKLILMNLFEMFDPSIYFIFNFQFNWIFIIMSLIIFMNNYWLIPSRFNMLLNKFFYILFKEFSMSMNKKFHSNLFIFLSLMFFIMFMNFFSLFPYIFSLTSHLLFNLSMSLSLWLSFFIYQLYNYPINFLKHLVPLNSPKFLMHFMVLIELISLFIRPWTLSIRLSSNLISGHLILVLLSNFMMNFIFILPFSMIIQNILLILEIFMSMIQAYVFSILLMLYFNESN